MANELCVPLLPCRDIDDIAGFYAVLGFRATYRQERPHPYLALRRDDLHLHFHGVPDADADAGAGSCLVVVDDVGALHRMFADGMRAAYGRVLTSGVPRLTAPRARGTTGRLTGFTVVDPSGNGIRVIGRTAPVSGHCSGDCALVKGIHVYRRHVEAPLKQLHDQIEDATALLLRTAGGFDDEDVREPSLLPGWTRAHVLTHLARGADALRDLLDGGPGYASQEARDEAIEAGAGRGAAELADDVRASAAAWREAVLRQPDEAWSRLVAPPLGIRPFPAGQLLVRRLVEVEVHHVDLAAGYRPSDWPVSFNQLQLPEPMRGQRADRIV